MPRALIVEIFGNASQFASELDRAAGRTRQFGKAAGVAGLAIAGGLAVGLEKSVKAAEAAQTSAARMDAAFKQSGQSADAFAGRIAKAESSSRNLGFSNIDVRQSLGSLEIATHSGAAAIRDLGVAQDIARFKGVGLGDASKTLTMAMAGSQRATKQLGLTIQPVTSTYDALKATMHGTETAQQKMELASAKAIDKQKTAKEVIALVTEKLHGQAQAYSQTAAGGMARFHAQMEALQENLGKALLPALTKVSGALADVAGYFAKHTTAAKALIIALGSVAFALGAVSIATKIAGAATKIWTAITKAAEAAQWAFNFAMEANPIGIIIIALIAFGVGLYELWTKSRTFRDIVKGVWTDIKAAVMVVVNFFRNDVPAAFEWVKTKAVTIFTAVKNFFVHVWDGLKAIWNTVWNAIVGVFDTIKDNIMRPFNWVKNQLVGIWDGLKKVWPTVWSSIVATVTGPIQTIIGWIKTAIGWVKDLINLIPGIHTPSGGPASSGGTKPGQPRGPVGGRALGGVFNVPTLAMIGERGPEAVIPLNRAGLGTGVGGGAPTINVTVHGWVGSDQQIAQRLRNELVSLGRREPNIFAGYA